MAGYGHERMVLDARNICVIMRWDCKAACVGREDSIMKKARKLRNNTIAWKWSMYTLVMMKDTNAHKM